MSTTSEENTSSNASQARQPLTDEELDPILVTFGQILQRHSPEDALTIRSAYSAVKRDLQHLFTGQLAAREREAEDRGWREGQRVGQYQAAEKLYHWITTLYLFKDDLNNKKAENPQRITSLLKDCEKLLNHNSKVYHAYVRGDRYKRMHSRQRLTAPQG